MASANPPELWDDGFPLDFSNQECRIEVRRQSVLGTATSFWNKKHRDEASKRGWAMPDGSFPIKDEADFEKAVHAIGRAKDRAKAIRHIRKRAKALGIPKEKWEHLKP